MPLARRLALALLALALLLPVAAQSASPRKIRVPLTSRITLQKLIEADLDVVTVKSPDYVDILEWPGDAAKLDQLGAARTVLDENPGRTAYLRSQGEMAARGRPSPARVRSAVHPDGAFRIESLPPFGSGSLAGFWTLDEVKMKLDSLVANDPNSLIADKIDTLGTTLQGRPIWGLRIGQKVTGPDPRPVTLLNALTHSREPEGMQSIFRFVDDLLTRYPSDPAARALLTQRVIYICPVVNPDGYRFNQTIHDSAAVFGYQRKNLRDGNHNGVTDYASGGSQQDGVDLNRNFGDHWGYPNGGSSTSTQSETYRGTAAFSEPESQAQRDLVIALHPKTAISFHTYSDLFLHPYGWTTAGTPDSMLFYEWDDEATWNVGYNSGPAPRILYSVNGEFSDWMYGDTLLKPRAFSWSPEVGSPDDDFWPPPSRIVPLADQCLRLCWSTVSIAGAHPRIGSASIAEGALNAGNVAHVSLRARNLGLAPTAAGLEAHLVALDDSTEVLQPTLTYSAIGSFQNGDPDAGATFVVAAHPALTPGHRARFLVEFSDAAGWFSRDTLDLIVGTPTPVFADAGTSLASWNATGTWGTKTGDPMHPATYLADTPNGLYGSNANTTLTLKTPLDLSGVSRAWLVFEGRWAFETDYDGETVEASLDSVTWTRLGGAHAMPGTAVTGTVQAAGLPVYRGTRWLWKNEWLDLSPFTGPAATRVRLRFHLRSDAGTGYDGMDLDSVKVVSYDPAAQPAPAAVGPGAAVARLELSPPAPNPARTALRLDFALPREGDARLEILDVAGRQVRVLAAGPRTAGRWAIGWDLRDESGRAVGPGIYFARLAAGSERVVRRIAVLH